MSSSLWFASLSWCSSGPYVWDGMEANDESVVDRAETRGNPANLNIVVALEKIRRRVKGREGSGMGERLQQLHEINRHRGRADAGSVSLPDRHRREVADLEQNGGPRCPIQP